MIKKCNENKDDIQAGLIAIRNTPLQCGSSPAQLLLGRPLQEHLPGLYNTNNQAKFKRNLQKERSKQVNYHDKHSKVNTTSNDYRKGQKVRVQDHRSHEWSKTGVIIDKVAPRSYNIKINDGITLRRNSKHIPTNPVRRQ